MKKLKHLAITLFLSLAACGFATTTGISCRANLSVIGPVAQGPTIVNVRGGADGLIEFLIETQLNRDRPTIVRLSGLWEEEEFSLQEIQSGLENWLRNFPGEIHIATDGGDLLYSTWPAPERDNE